MFHQCWEHGPWRKGCDGMQTPTVSTSPHQFVKEHYRVCVVGSGRSNALAMRFLPCAFPTPPPGRDESVPTTFCCLYATTRDDLYCAIVLAAD